MLINEIHALDLLQPVRRQKARVELYLGSSLTSICNCGEILQDFTIERTGENRFFGFGICQKINGTIIDLNKTIDISEEHTIEAAFGVGEDFVYPFPKFYIQEFSRDEGEGTVAFTGYDILFKAENFTFADLLLPSNYLVSTIAASCARLLEVPIKFVNIDETLLETRFTTNLDANFSGDESLRRVLDAIAEFTQSIYYINSQWELVFRRLNPAEASSITVDEDQYLSFQNGGERRLKSIASVTEGEDNVESVGDGEGVTQYIRDNPFLTLRDDIGSLLERAQANVGGMTLSEFDMEWNGNYLLEIGDKIAIETEEGTFYSYLLDDSLTFDGGLFQVTTWHFDNNEGERATNPISIGEALNQTFVKVDKANKEIVLQAAKVSANTSAISALQINTESISASVTRVEETANEKLGSLEDELVKVQEEVSLKMDTEAINAEFKKVREEGVEKVETSTGFTFNEVGLTIKKSNSEMKTQITEDGMTVYRNEDKVLVADHEGVKAKDLSATTYLIVGGRSRFENYGSNRTGCFWIGN